MNTRQTSQRGRGAFTLVEVMVTIAIASVVCLATIASLSWSLQFQALQQQRMGAVAILQREMEEIRQELHPDLIGTRESWLDDNRTPDNPGDDIPCNLIMTLYHADGTPFASGETPATHERITIELTLTWIPPGAKFQLAEGGSGRIMHETLMTTLVPR
ncbi:type II secretion system protein [Candidatus Sumerlaeota bacterium]|nr:type II secretion system protein [Candidatus Sumerlaeota bacterium]